MSIFNEEKDFGSIGSYLKGITNLNNMNLIQSLGEFLKEVGLFKINVDREN